MIVSERINTYSLDEIIRHADDLIRTDPYTIKRKTMPKIRSSFSIRGHVEIKKLKLDEYEEKNVIHKEPMPTPSWRMYEDLCYKNHG